MTSAGTNHQTTVGGGMKPTVVTQAKSGSKAGVTTVTTTGLTASGNATRPAVRLGTTTFSNNGFKTATTNNHHLMQQPVITETDSRLRRKLISIFWQRLQNSNYQQSPSNAATGYHRNGQQAQTQANQHFLAAASKQQLPTIAI